MNLLSPLPQPGRAESLMLMGSAGWIECLLEAPKSPPVGLAVICHPHPLYGGALSNKVTYQLARTALAQGLIALRFNFRGVGKSQGLHDEGRGETDDAVLLGASLRAAYPASLPLVLAGFSFGSFIALRAAASLKPEGLMSVAPPFAKYFGGMSMPQHPNCPWAVLHSQDDEVVPYTEAVASLERYQPQPELTTVDGAGHFFHGRLADVDECFRALIHKALA